jgi:hypothetical protein
MAGALDAVTPGLRLQLRQWLETLDNRWNQTVLGYGRQQQFKLLDKLGMPSVDLTALGQVLGGLLATVALGGALWAAWDARRRTPWQRLQRSMQDEMARLGVDAPPQLPPGGVARPRAGRPTRCRRPENPGSLALRPPHRGWQASPA